MKWIDARFYILSVIVVVTFFLASASGVKIEQSQSSILKSRTELCGFMRIDAAASHLSIVTPPPGDTPAKAALRARRYAYEEAFVASC